MHPTECRANIAWQALTLRYPNAPRSDIGGLAFASFMGRLRKWRVLVLERHFKSRERVREPGGKSE
jgi:hypothetical protein